MFLFVLLLINYLFLLKTFRKYFHFFSDVYNSLELKYLNNILVEMFIRLSIK